MNEHKDMIALDDSALDQVNGGLSDNAMHVLEQLFTPLADFAGNAIKTISDKISADGTGKSK